MTIEEEEGEKVMDEKSSVVDVDASRFNIPKNKDTINVSKEDSVRSKMEAMQKRIDELKEKVKFEGELLYCKGTVFDEEIMDRKSLDSLSDVKSKDSLSQDSKSSDEKIRDNEELSDTSLYFSASSYSMCSVNSTSSDSAYCSFTKFVNNYMKNQDHKERLSLLQLHSKKQISLNMMKTSLLEMEKKCSEELELIERNLKHLNKLAEEFNVNKELTEEDINSYKMTPLDFNSSGDSGSRRPMAQALLKFLPVGQGSSTKLEIGQSKPFLNSIRKMVLANEPEPLQPCNI